MKKVIILLFLIGLALFFASRQIPSNGNKEQKMLSSLLFQASISFMMPVFFIKYLTGKKEVKKSDTLDADLF